MLIGGVVDHNLGNNAESPPMGLSQELSEVSEVSVYRMNAGVVRNVIAIVPERRREEGEKPEGGNAQVLKIIEFSR
jgi:hypothetical protein